ncbi:helix-hairpin-helix domain-containing protein [Nocardia sp. CA-151230]|uniref:ComEA family DNA-binding protein n=1 Tax=Nocardia sp. CA-151230 TaxID=3239982 RepID=UPI003D920755
MPRLDERTPLQRLNARATDPRSGPAEVTGDPAEFASGRPHPGRWDEDSLDQLVEPEHRADRHPGGSSPDWLSEPCGSVSLWHERLVPERFRGTRWDPGPRGVLVIAALGVLAILFAGYVTLREKPVSQPVPPIAALSETAPADQDGAAPEAAASAATVTVTPAPGAAQPPTSRPASSQADRIPLATTATGAPGGSVTPGELVVSVVGLVEHGGLRRFPTGSRVADALRVAAPRPEADLSTLNLAQPLIDGDQIIVGRTTPRPTTQQVGTTIVNSAHPPANSPAPSGQPRSTAVPAKVNLNTATESDLDTLPGVGPVTARAILTWRTRHGRFTSIDQLSEIEGIGHSRLNRLRDRVTI